MVLEIFLDVFAGNNWLYILDQHAVGISNSVTGRLGLLRVCLEV